MPGNAAALLQGYKNNPPANQVPGLLPRNNFSRPKSKLIKIETGQIKIFTTEAGMNSKRTSSYKLSNKTKTSAYKDT